MGYPTYSLLLSLCHTITCFFGISLLYLFSPHSFYSLAFILSFPCHPTSFSFHTLTLPLSPFSCSFHTLILPFSVFESVYIHTRPISPYISVFFLLTKDICISFVPPSLYHTLDILSHPSTSLIFCPYTHPFSPNILPLLPRRSHTLSLDSYPF